MSAELAGDIASIARIASVQKILRVICCSTGMGFAAIAEVTSEHWIACAVRDEIGLGVEPGFEVPSATTICNDVRERGEMVVIDHVATDERYSRHPAAQLHGFQSCISVPIRRQDGTIFGTLCAVDPKPMRLNTPQTTGMFTLFAELVSLHLEMQDQLAIRDQSLRHERELGRLREQLIAIVGHDLRNPVQAIASSAQTLAKEWRDEVLVSVIGTSCDRIKGIVADLVDLARVRIRTGTQIAPRSEVDLLPVLESVIAECRVIWPGRRLDARLHVPERISCDPARIAQLFSNLLTNALKYGDGTAPVGVEAHNDDHGFRLCVVNRGAPIPPEVRARLLHPWFPELQEGVGLGLGLYICSEIARQHGGTLDVSSDANETRFTFCLPAPRPSLSSPTRSDWIDGVLRIAGSLASDLELHPRKDWPLPHHLETVLTALGRASRFLEKTNATDERRRAIQAHRDQLRSHLEAKGMAALEGETSSAAEA